MELRLPTPAAKATTIATVSTITPTQTPFATSSSTASYASTFTSTQTATAKPATTYPTAAQPTTSLTSRCHVRPVDHLRQCRIDHPAQRRRLCQRRRGRFRASHQLRQRLCGEQLQRRKPRRASGGRCCNGDAPAHGRLFRLHLDRGLSRRGRGLLVRVTGQHKQADRRICLSPTTHCLRRLITTSISAVPTALSSSTTLAAAFSTPTAAPTLAAAARLCRHRPRKRRHPQLGSGRGPL